MTSRDLPNVYVTLNDMSALIEGNDSLAVGITLRADRGPVGQALRVTDSDDFLSRYTFTGKPGTKQDSTYFDVLELLKSSNNVYVSRSANNPLYGGLVVKKEKEIAEFKGVAEHNAKRIIVDGNIANKFEECPYIRIADGKNSYRYVVVKAEETGDKTSVLVTEKVSSKLIAALEDAKAAKATAIKSGILAGDASVLDGIILEDVDPIAQYVKYENAKELLESAKAVDFDSYQAAKNELDEAVDSGDYADAFKEFSNKFKVARAGETEAYLEYVEALEAYLVANDAYLREEDTDAKAAKLAEVEAAKAALDATVLGVKKAEADATTYGAKKAAVDATLVGNAMALVELRYQQVEDAADKAAKEASMTVSFPIYSCTKPVDITTYYYKDGDGNYDIIRTKKDIADEEKGYNGAFEVAGNMEEIFFAGDRLKLTFDEDTPVKLIDKEAAYYYTVVGSKYIPESASTLLYVKEHIQGSYPMYEAPADGSEGAHVGAKLSIEALANPETFQVFFEEDDLFLLTGKDQGAYNNKIGIAIDSGVETDLNEPYGAFKLYVHNGLTGADLEEFLVALSPAARAMNGVNIEIEGILEDEATGSRYIQVVKNNAVDFSEVVVPPSTPGRALNNFEYLGGGYDGDELTIADDINALEVFADKNVAISLLVNGGVENILYQLAMLSICESRKDCFAILRTLRSHEKLAVPAQRVRSMIDYKKETLGSTEYLAAMYGPHVTTYDTYNLRNVTIGADSVACRRWIEVIRDYGYPRAAAGIDDGFLSGIGLDWKIGDESSEAGEFNDASMNMIVWDAKRKFYYLNTQNTLQLANSAFRNMGAVLNVLDIKEWMDFNLKYFVQKPIDGDGNLQESILRVIEGYMEKCKSSGRVTDFYVQDITTKTNISNNELHFVLTLCPAYYAQKIYLAINVVNATFDFQILQSM